MYLVALELLREYKDLTALWVLRSSFRRTNNYRWTGLFRQQMRHRIECLHFFGW